MVVKVRRKVVRKLFRLYLKLYKLYGQEAGFLIKVGPKFRRPCLTKTIFAYDCSGVANHTKSAAPHQAIRSVYNRGS